MTKAVLLLVVIFTQSVSLSQLKITKTEKLPLTKSNSWSNPIFSPDGKKIFYSVSGFQGVWEYTPATKSARQVVADPQSGYNFAVSSDGKKVAYRRTLNEMKLGNRVQEIVTKDLADGRTQFIASGSNLSTPTFVGSSVVYTDNVTTMNLNMLAPNSKPFVVGIEDTKISLVVNGAKRLLDPMKRGSYIWPQLSPEGTRLVVGDIMSGTIVCDLQGNVLARLGKRNAPVWTRNGKWIVYMKDKDDGHAIISSDLFCISPDGKQVKQLTFTNNEIEMNPACSPTENKIVCNTLDGEIIVLTYEEVKR